MHIFYKFFVSFFEWIQFYNVLMSSTQSTVKSSESIGEGSRYCNICTHKNRLSNFIRIYCLKIIYDLAYRNYYFYQRFASTEKWYQGKCIQYLWEWYKCYFQDKHNIFSISGHFLIKESVQVILFMILESPSRIKIWCW